MVPVTLAPRADPTEFPHQMLLGVVMSESLTVGILGNVFEVCNATCTLKIIHVAYQPLNLFIPSQPSLRFLVAIEM